MIFKLSILSNYAKHFKGLAPYYMLLLFDKFEARDDKEYEVKVIIDSVIYKKETKDQIPAFYYLIL